MAGTRRLPDSQRSRSGRNGIANGETARQSRRADSEGAKGQIRAAETQQPTTALAAEIGIAACRETGGDDTGGHRRQPARGEGARLHRVHSPRHA